MCFLQIAHKYLVEKHLSPEDKKQFKEQLYRIWFELYARRGSSRWVESGTAPKHTFTKGICDYDVNCLTLVHWLCGAHPVGITVSGNWTFLSILYPYDLTSLTTSCSSDIIWKDVAAWKEKSDQLCIWHEYYNISINVFVVCCLFCLLLGLTHQGLNMCLLARPEEGGQSSAFITGSSSTYKRSWDISTTKATASMPIHPR